MGRPAIANIAPPMLIIVEAPGKILLWSRLVADLGWSARVVATRGHVRHFPPVFNPLGIRIDESAALDFGRDWDPARREKLEAALKGLPEDGLILVATDDDMEGDVIALDILHLVLDTCEELLGRTLRLRPGELTAHAISRAYEVAFREPPRETALRAVPGRSRAIIDRWTGALLTGLAGQSCGRVRSALVGLTDRLAAMAAADDGLPETGEIVLQVQADDGGGPFFAHVPFHGTETAVIAAVARRFRNRRIPGRASALRPVGAAPAPRFGNVAPFNTGDALVHAARFHGIPVGRAMRGLQSAYVRGRISYPRTTGRTCSAQAMEDVWRLARRARLELNGARDPGDSDALALDGAHEALHPLPPPSGCPSMAETVRRTPGRPETEPEIEDAMVALVARRAFEALEVEEREPGRYHPGEGTNLSSSEIDALRDLDWLRMPETPRPWGRYGLTECRTWPLDSVLVDLMMRHGIGRPSTWADQVESVLEADLVTCPDLGRLPEPTPRGRRLIDRIPASAADPETCRETERLFSAPVAEQLESEADVTRYVRGRLREWLQSRPPDIRNSLAELVPGATEALQEHGPRHETADPLPESIAVPDHPRPSPPRPSPKRRKESQEPAEDANVGASDMTMEP